jgi:nicotinamide riboside kinase
LVNEYARRYLSVYGEIEAIPEQFRILQKQYGWEENVSNADLMITDCPIFLGFLYCLQYRNINSQKDTMWVNDIFKQMSKYNIPQRYDIIFHVPPKLKPVRDGIRAEYQFDDVWRENSDQTLQFIFKMFPPKKFYIIEPIDLDERVDFCIEKIKEIVKTE